MSNDLRRFAEPIEGVSEMCDLYGYSLQPEVQKFSIDHYNALINALRLPAEIAIYDAVRERCFPPQPVTDIEPSTALGRLILNIETLRDATTTVSIETGVIRQTCGLMEGFILSNLQDFSQLPESPEPWHYDPAVIVLDTSGKPIGLRKTESAQTTFLVEGVDDQTKALAGAVVKLCDAEGQDITSSATVSTKHPDLKVVTTEKLASVTVDRYSTFTLDPNFIKQIDYGDEGTRIALNDVSSRLRSIAEVAGIF